MRPSAATVREQATSTAMRVIEEELYLPEGTALIATGSFARGESTPYSDVDLVLLVEQGVEVDKRELEELWYPFWDAKLRLDYSVRTPRECVSLMADDPKVALALLDMTFLDGDEDLATKTRVKVLDTWRRLLIKHFDSIIEAVHERWQYAGSVVDMTHPDLKYGRGGLRDAEFLRALGLGHLCDVPDVSAARQLLVDTRILLHAGAGRSRDVLDPEFAADIASTLGYADRFELSKALAAAAREIDSALQKALDTARDALPRRSGFALRRLHRTPLDVDVMLGGKGIVLSNEPNFNDPGLPLRVAACAARSGHPVVEATWDRLATRWTSAMAERDWSTWTPAMRSDFFTVLGVPDHVEKLITLLDSHGLWEFFCPEWSTIRELLPRESSHVHTVDKHTIETVKTAAGLVVQVARPDLLLLSALYHDFGKGVTVGKPPHTGEKEPHTGAPQKHEDIGAELVREAARKMGLSETDAGCAATVVAQHSLLAKVAATQDPTSTEAIEAVEQAVRFDVQALEILEALTIADAKSTGPHTWSKNLQAALETLVPAVRSALTSSSPKPPEFSWGSAKYAVEQLANDRYKIYWRSDGVAELISVMAVLRRGAWDVEQLRFRDGELEVVVASLIGATLDEQTFIQEVRRDWSQRKNEPLELPTLGAVAGFTIGAVDGRATGDIAVYWFGTVLELRATSIPQVGLKRLLLTPDLQWLKVSYLGAVAIVQLQTSEKVSAPDTERYIRRVWGKK